MQVKLSLIKTFGFIKHFSLPESKEIESLFTLSL